MVFRSEWAGLGWTGLKDFKSNGDVLNRFFVRFDSDFNSGFGCGLVTIRLMFKLAWLYQRIVLSYSEQPQPQGQPVSTQAQPGSTSTSRSATLSSSGNGDMDDDDDRAHTEDPERQPLLASSGKEKEGKSEELIKEFQRM